MNQMLSKIQFCPPVATSDFYELLAQFLINLGILIVIARIIYYKWNKNSDYLFAQIITGVVVFIICAMLRWVQLELGLVLGLFAIFAIIRFRTTNVPVKEMAYLFMVVGISAVNALLQISNCLHWIIFANLLLILLTFTLEKTFFSNKLSYRIITFDDPDLLKPSQHQTLISRLKEITELNILRFDIGKVDYVKKTAQIKIYFKGNGNGTFNESKNNGDDD